MGAVNLQEKFAKFISPSKPPDAPTKFTEISDTNEFPFSQGSPCKKME
jgi:hypothetical protein